MITIIGILSLIICYLINRELNFRRSDNVDEKILILLLFLLIAICSIIYGILPALIYLR